MTVGKMVSLPVALTTHIAVLNNNFSFLFYSYLYLSVLFCTLICSTFQSNIIQSKKSETVKVVLRCRPMLEDEISRKCQKYNYYYSPSLLPRVKLFHQFFFFCRVVKIDTLGGVVHLTDTHAKGDEVKREFTYDAVYDAK